MKFFIHSKYGEILDLALHLQQTGHEVVFYVPEHDYSLVGEGLVPKVDNWISFLEQDYTWVFDGCSDGKFQDWLRSKGEQVFGGSQRGDRMENDRQLNQAWFKAAGFAQPKSRNFTDFNEALKFVEAHPDNLWILKQNGEAPKHLSHMGKFPGQEDMIFHLEQLKKNWSIGEYGPVDFDLAEIVQGMEVAASVWFNGEDFLRTEDGLITGFLNFEEKKEGNGGTGETCGEMGTTFIQADERNKLFNRIVNRPKILEGLQKMKFRGVFDINCIQQEDGKLTALEPTMRLGIPSTSYEMEEALGNCAEVIEAVATGQQVAPQLTPGIGMVMCLVAKPFPIEADVEKEATSQEERLWILEQDNPIASLTPDQAKHIHLYNFHFEDGVYKVATKNGYLLTVTGSGETISRTRSSLIKYIKNNLYLPGMKYRTDIGVRVEQAFAKRKER
jgi:phosphoribosylamine--glycine ligase